jgi:hypothetical protein
VAGDAPDDSGGKCHASSGEEESIENDDEDGSDLDDESQIVDEATSDDGNSCGEDNSIDEGSVSDRGSDSECDEVEGDESVENDCSVVSANHPLGRRFSGQMLALSSSSCQATNRPGASTSVKKATSRFNQWMRRRNVATPVKSPSPKKKHSSFQQERWQMNIAGALNIAHLFFPPIISR